MSRAIDSKNNVVALFLKKALWENLSKNVCEEI